MSTRIPDCRIDEEGAGRHRSEQQLFGDEGDNEGDADNSSLTPEEIGRASSYEDVTEVQRRIDRGQEEEGDSGREQADESDVAGAPHSSELPRNRTDQDTTASFAESSAVPPSPAGAAHPSDGSEQAPKPDTDPVTAGPIMAELVATRAELRRVESELKKATAERYELHEALARRQADFENFRKRIERERSESYHRTVHDVVKHLLPVVDNLQRALDAEASVEATESDGFRDFLHGVGLINKQLNGVLESLGVEPVETVGQPFDPHFHEAVAMVETDRYAPDTVVEELVRGYRLGDKLLRPAMVKVAK